MAFEEKVVHAVARFDRNFDLMTWACPWADPEGDPEPCGSSGRLEELLDDGWVIEQGLPSTLNDSLVLLLMKRLPPK